MWTGARRNSTSLEKSLVLPLVHCFIGSINSIRSHFTSLVVYYFHQIRLNTISLPYFPLSIPPQAFSLMPA